MIATIRLTRTERTLLEKAARKPHGNLHAMIWYSTSARGGIHGTRTANALKSLIRKGLADGYSAESHYSPNRDGWGSTHATEFSARITDAGRAVLVK